MEALFFPDLLHLINSYFKKKRPSNIQLPMHKGVFIGTF